MKPGSMAQHSRVDLLLRAPMTVTLRVLKSGAVAVAAMAAVLVRRVVRSLNETILWVYLNVCGGCRSSRRVGGEGKGERVYGVFIQLSYALNH